MSIHHHYGHFCLFWFTLGEKGTRRKAQRGWAAGYGGASWALLAGPRGSRQPLPLAAATAGPCLPPRGGLAMPSHTKKPHQGHSKTTSIHILWCMEAPALVQWHSWLRTAQRWAVKGRVGSAGSTGLMVLLGSLGGEQDSVSVWKTEKSVLHFGEVFHALRKIDRVKLIPLKLP